MLSASDPSIAPRGADGTSPVGNTNVPGSNVIIPWTCSLFILSLSQPGEA